MHVFVNLDCGGAENRVMDIYRYLNKDNIQFDFLILQQGTFYFTEEIIKLGGRIYSICHPRKNIIRHMYQMYKVFISTPEINTIHSHTSFHSGLVLFVALLAGKNIRISHARTSSTGKFGVLKKLLLYIGRKLISFSATKCIAVSEEAGKYVFGSSKKAGKNFEIVKNVIDFEKYITKSEKDINALRDELGITKEHFVIIQVGRLEKVKNHQFTINLAEKFKLVNSQFKVIFAGDGSLRTELEENIRKKELEEHIKLLGLRKDIPDLLKCANVLLLPSFYEGLPGVVLEAQASGIPSLVSNTVTKEVDLNLQLVNYLSINGDEDELWINKLSEIQKDPHKKANIEIKEAFELSGFTLSSVANYYKNIYGANS